MKLGWQNRGREQAPKLWVELVDVFPGTGKGVCCPILLDDPSQQATYKVEIFKMDEQLLIHVGLKVFDRHAFELQVSDGGA